VGLSSRLPAVKVTHDSQLLHRVAARCDANGGGAATLARPPAPAPTSAFRVILPVMMNNVRASNQGGSGFTNRSSSPGWAR
jgi:hypothetical protein